MNAITNEISEMPASWKLLDRGKVAMTGLIIAESAIFTIFVVAYLFYLGRSLTGPTPREVLETPIFYTICLLSSSLTIHFASKSLERDRGSAFLGLWLLTIALGGLFLYGTGVEWYTQADPQRRSDDLNQPLWDNLLLCTHFTSR
jgi:cytochrome c oxidase subunit 3